MWPYADDFINTRGATANGHCLFGQLCHGQKCLHLFSDSEACHEQMGLIPRSNGSLDI